MKRCSNGLLKAIATMIGLIICTPAPLAAEDIKYIDINNPFIRKMPMAVPYFKSFSDKPKEKIMARKMADMLSDALAFTGYFKMIDRAAFLEDPREKGILGPNLTFSNWRGVGSELLITGGIRGQNDVLEVEMRLFDTFKERLIIGKKYKGWANDQRRMVHRFCSEVIYHLTGNRGVFDSRIAFISNGSGHKEIYICEFDGYEPKQFTHHKAISLFPAWSSSGKWLAYTSYYKGKPDLFIRHVHEKRGATITKKGFQITPAWIPGRFELAATLSYSGDQEIYLLTGNGKIIKRLTNSRGIDVEPTWSPDGKKMAFVSKRSGTPQIYIKEIGSSRVERLTFEGRYNTQPSWSPKGDKIAYSAMQGSSVNIFVIDVNGGSPVQLTDGYGDNEAPSWSPDGSLIAFSSTREGPSRIYIMTAYGTDQRRLLALPGEQSTPRWSPSIINN
jgi:TolB protein